MKMKTLTTAVMAALLAAATAGAVIVVDYEFNEPAGGLSTAVDSAGSAIVPWNNNAASYLNGAGQLEFAATMPQQQPFLGPDAISGGTAFLRYDLDNWTGGDYQLSFGMRLRNDANTANSIFKFNHKTGTGWNGNLNNNNNGWTGVLFGLPNENKFDWANGVSYIVGVDFDNDTWQVWEDRGQTGTYIEATAGPQTFNLGGETAFGQVNTILLASNNPVGDIAGVNRYVLGTDFNEIAAIPEPGTLGLFTLVGGVMLAIRRRYLK
jgi:hypothetical protein